MESHKTMNSQMNSDQSLSPTDALVALLEARQEELGLNDARFASLLGISRPLWWMTRSGDRRVNLMLLRGVAQAFSDLDEQILSCLRSKS